MATLYIIDSSKPFRGFTTHITDENGLIPEDGGITLEEYRIKTRNPHFIGISSEELTLKHKELRESYMSEEFKEITEERYEELLNCSYPLCYNRNVLFDYFFISSCYAYDLHLFCFKHIRSGKCFSANRSVRTGLWELEEEINTFLKEKNLMTDSLDTFVHERYEPLWMCNHTKENNETV